MHRTETVVLKLRSPSRGKRQWLEATAQAFRQAVQCGLDAALSMGTSSRARIHEAAYHAARSLGLPADYCRMAVNQAVQIARSYYGLRKAKRKVGRPRVVRADTIGLGVNAYRVEGTVLRVSTGNRGQYLWFPLSVPPRWRDRLQYVRGDARLFRQGADWYVILPLKVPNTPTACGGDGAATVIGVDLGIVHLAVASTPDGVRFWNGKPIRWRREHFASLRRRYQRHRRTDRVRAMRGKESRWIRDVNHKISKQLVALATRYPNPVLAMESLDGIRDRVRGSKRFNRMVASWAFRQLRDLIEYKAEKSGVRVVYVNPKYTSCTCPRCGHSTRSNRSTQSNFRCVACGYRGNADAVAAMNIAGAAAGLLRHGPPDTARPDEGQPSPAGAR
jgi:IS605 OrfB family transposase